MYCGDCTHIRLVVIYTKSMISIISTWRSDDRKIELPEPQAVTSISGKLELDGTYFGVGQMGATQKMCADPALMELERTYLQLLETVHNVNSEESGYLEINGSEGKTLRFVAIR